MPALRFRWRAPLAFVLLAGTTLATGPARPDKAETWVEVTSPHFTVMSNDGERTARRIAGQFEQIRVLYSRALSPNLRLDPGIPIEIIAARNEKSLSQIIPEYWVEKGHTHPAGIFLPGVERNYIALRTDVQGEFPYLTVYHEYVHLILSLNYQHLPLWLNEGYCTYFGSATLLPKFGRVGQPNAEELGILKQSKLLPLDTLFAVDEQSPYYTQAEKTNVFYAESWALVHYLMSDEERQRDSQLERYLALVEKGDDAVEGAKSAFGDLGDLERDLNAYLSRTSYRMREVPLPNAPDSQSFLARPVPPAEVDATLGEFDVMRSQFDNARPKVEEALKIAPDSAAAQESMGLLLFREHQRAEAQKYFSRAGRLGSKSALTYYFDGMLLVSGGADEDDFDEAQAALEKAVALRPELAAAWDALANLYRGDPAARNKALAAEERAVSTMPGEPRYRFNLAVLLFHSDRVDEARDMAQRLQKYADPELAKQAGELLAEINRTARNERASSNEIGALSQLKTAGDAQPGEEPAAHSPSDSPHSYSMIGTITEVTCANAPELGLTLEASGIAMHLHAANAAAIEWLDQTGKTREEKRPCSEFAGQRARIRYELSDHKPWDGEIISVELDEAP